MQNSATLVAAVIAAVVAITGYLLNQQANRRVQRAQLYAEALRAIADLEELPYRIRRREDSLARTRERVGREVNDVFVAVSFYMRWLRIDSLAVGIAYQVLARKAITYGEAQRAHAWASPPLASDRDANLAEVYHSGSQVEKYACEQAMRSQLKLFRIRRGADAAIIGRDKANNTITRPPWVVPS